MTLDSILTSYKSDYRIKSWKDPISMIDLNFKTHILWIHNSPSLVLILSLCRGWILDYRTTIFCCLLYCKIIYTNFLFLFCLINDIVLFLFIFQFTLILFFFQELHVFVLLNNLFLLFNYFIFGPQTQLCQLLNTPLWNNSRPSQLKREL